VRFRATFFDLFAASFRFDYAGKAKANENNGLRFAERNESFRDERSKSLKSLRAANHPFWNRVFSTS
jgi:hypothetical protein